MNRTPLLLLALALACGRSPNEAAPPATETVRAPIAQVERVAVPALAEISGVVEAARSTSVGSRVAAMVTAVHVELGGAVKTGQLLVTIDAVAAEGQVAQAEGLLAQARAASALAERNAERFEALARTNSASELELDSARMQRDQARGAVAQAEGALSAARSIARESRVVAPYAGRVVARSVEVGDLAVPGRPLVTIESESGRRLRVAVPERIAAEAALARGARIEVAIDARPELGRFAAELVEIAPGPDPGTHALTVKLDLGGIEVAAGAAGRAWIAGDARGRETVLVPAEALVERGGLTLVVVREGDGRAASRVVSVGERGADGRVEILAGLAGGESVALGLAAAPPAGSRIEPAGAAGSGVAQ